MTATTAATTPLDLDQLPGHLIRRLQQIAVAIFLQESEGLGITPVQYAAMQAIDDTPGLDQRTLSRTIGFDTSTIGGVIDRLEARGLLTRNTVAEDRRVRRLTLTPDGQALLAAVVPGMLRAQVRILEPLPENQRPDFLRMLALLVRSHHGVSRAPGDG